jgi:hypothetical protein
MQRNNDTLAIAALILGLAGIVRASDAIISVSGTPDEYGSATHTFDAGGTTAKANWADTNKWSNGVLPGVNDDVVIACGECSVSNSVVVKSVKVNASAKLKVESKGVGGIPARVNFQAGSLDIATGALVAIGGTSTTAVDAQTQDPVDLPAAIEVAISGSLTNAGLLSIGGRGGTNTLGVAIGADLTMAGGSTTAIYAGRATNALNLVGIYRQASPVNAAKIELQENAVLYTENDAWSGGCIKYSCGDFIVAHDAKVDTVNRGYAFKKCAIVNGPNYPVDMPVITNVPNLYFTYSPGRSAPGAYNGAGHGGQGYGTIYTPSQTKQATGYGQAYGYRLAPYLAGSSGNIYSGPYTGSGSIVVFADRILVDGTLSAYGGVVDGHGAPSAGGIMLVSDSFDFGPDAVVTAEGTYNKQSASGGRHGAGGRVALLCGFGSEDIATIVAGEEPAEVDVRDASNYFIAAIDAKSGRDWNLTRGSNKGTTCFARPDTLPKRLVAVRGTLGQIRAESASWGYRSRTFASGASVTLSMADTSDVLHEGNNYTFCGWELRPATNAAIVVGSGPEASVTFVLNEDSLVTWVWEKTACMMNLAAAAGGKITYNGTNYTAGSACVFNLACGAESGEISAVPDDGYELLYWVGDIEPVKARSATITITSVAPRDITAIFRPVAEPKARVFNAASPSSSGNWLDPARWTDGIVPGLNDPVTIASGTCVVSNYLDVKSVTVASSAYLLVADYGTSGAFVREITAKLTDGNLVVAQGGVAAFGGMTATAAGVKAQTYRTAHLPARVSLTVPGCVTNSGSLSVGGRGGLYITNTLGVVVASEFVMADGSVTAIYAGRAENPLILTGLWSQASVVSASRFELLGTAVLYSENDGWSGNPVRFETDGDLTVGASARVDTISRGYNYFRVPADMSDDYPADMPYVDSIFRNFTYAPGRAPAGAYVIAAHGGGGNAPTYGWPLAAYLPGSPGNLHSTMHCGSGSIVVIADRMKIDGTLTAFGGEYNDHGSPSAGGIMLVAGSYEFSPEAIITASPRTSAGRMSALAGTSRSTAHPSCSSPAARPTRPSTT